MTPTYEKYEKHTDELAATVERYACAFKKCTADPKIDPEIWVKAWSEIKRVNEIDLQPIYGMRNKPECLAYASVRKCARVDWEDYDVSDNERMEIIENIREANDIIGWLAVIMEEEGGEE